MDLLSRKVVGRAMSEQMNSTLVESALQMALQTRQPESSLLHQSDQGSQQTSMSRVGNCYDNAVAESFFGTFK
jgi:transposase InsO family protein